MAANAAVTLSAVETASAQVPDGPLHAPPQDENAHPVPGVALIVITVPGMTSMLQGDEQVRLSGARLKLPPPEIELIESVLEATMVEDGADVFDSPAALVADAVQV